MYCCILTSYFSGTHLGYHFNNWFQICENLVSEGGHGRPGISSPCPDRCHLFSLVSRQLQLGGEGPPGAQEEACSWVILSETSLVCFSVLFLSGRLKSDCPTFQENYCSNILRNQIPGKTCMRGLIMAL